MLAGAIAACQVVGRFEKFHEDTTVADTGASGAPEVAAAAGSSGAAPGACAAQPSDVTDRGPNLVGLELSDGTCLWVDRTEVTQAQYGEFVTANPPGLRAPYCEWNVDFAPSSSCLETANVDPGNPAVCVDECDAEAFCVWAGKRLCHGDWSSAGIDDPKLSEWFAACSTDGMNDYPYGDEHEAGVCNDSKRPASGCATGNCELTEAGTLTACKTSYGAFDLTGNAAEWVDECDSTIGEDDQCRSRGGGVDNDPGSAICRVVGNRARSFTGHSLGFRCCARE